MIELVEGFVRQDRPGFARRIRNGALVALLLTSGLVVGLLLGQRDSSERITEAFGVWWPGTVPAIQASWVRQEELARRLTAFAPSPAYSVSDLNAAISDEHGQRSSGAAELPFEAAAALARARATDDPAQLLSAAERLAQSGFDPASACNRARLWEELGLSYLSRQSSRSCPIASARPPTFAADRWGGVRRSANTLPPRELAAVTALLQQSRHKEAVARIRLRAQAWRVYLETDGLSEWSTSLATDSRIASEEKLRKIATAYFEGTGNRAPLALVLSLVLLPDSERARARDLIASWLDGSQRAADYDAEAATRILDDARSAAEDLLPPLVPSIDLVLTHCRYHLGDSAGLRRRAIDLRRRFSEEEFPWVIGRAHFLEAVSYNGAGDWERVVSSANESERILERIGEEAYAAYLGTIRAMALVALDQRERAAVEILHSVQRLARTDDTRFIAFAEGSFGRYLGADRYPNFAIVMQREALAHLRADGNAPALADALVGLAQLLAGQGHLREARHLLDEAGGLAATIGSDGARRRAQALVALASAELESRNRPAVAVRHITAFLDTFRGFGEQFSRPEALLLRARAYLRLSEPERASQDLFESIAVTTAQGLTARDPLSASRILDGARSAIEELFQAHSDGVDPDGEPAELFRQLRALQLDLLFGTATLPAKRRVPLREGYCSTEFMSLESELVTWTTCGQGRTGVSRTPIARLRLAQLAGAFRAAAEAGDLNLLRTASANLSDVLVRPVRHLLGPSGRWVVIPDAPFSDVPFNWLSDDDRFLFETRFVEIASAANGRDHHSSSKTWRALTIGDPDAPGRRVPLPAARREARDVALLLGGPVLLGDSATFTQTSQLALTVDVLHFAGHFDAPPKIGAASIQFASDPAHADGRVGVKDIAALDLSRLRLVFLSGCSSTNATTARLSGSFGHTHSFVAAGARTAIGGLWQVEDTLQAAVVTDFYRNLTSGQEPEQALRSLWLAELKNESAVAEAARLSAAIALQATAQ